MRFCSCYVTDDEVTDPRSISRPHETSRSKERSRKGNPSFDDDDFDPSDGDDEEFAPSKKRYES